ncbi:MAG: glycoside hydrolase family 127 protein [Pirellulales bacterium]|nr:glycoside hydrolase family 127 protein [Pirellulales bacterium]
MKWLISRAPVALLLALASVVSGANPGRKAAQLKDVVLRNELGTRYAAATANLFIHQDRYSAESFRASALGKPGALWWDWPGDQIGRWFSLLSAAEQYGWSTAAYRRRMIADRVLPLQNQHGYFGPELPFDQKDLRILSGNAFALRGLMDAYEDTRDPRFINAARRMRDYFENTYPSWHAASDGRVHEFWGHCLDGLVKLYQLDNNGQALDLARRIAGRVGRTAHTHHSLSMMRGMVDLSNATHEPDMLVPVRDYLTWCRENRLISGGVPETMPSSKQDEGCALADYVVLNLMMFETTGELTYLEDAEHVLVNHFFMNQFPSGGFGHRGYAPDVIGGKIWQGWDGQFGSENPGCCSLWGQWALGQVGRYLVTQCGKDFEINLYAQADISFPDRYVRFVLDGDFPRCRQNQIRVLTQPAASFGIFLRIPSWADGARITINGQPIEVQREDGRVKIVRAWEYGDQVVVHLDGELRLVEWAKADHGLNALFDGPLCLALSSTEADVSLNWKLVLDRDMPARDSEGRFKLTAGKESFWKPLRPIADDWLSCHVQDPNRLRILFDVQQPD